MAVAILLEENTVIIIIMQFAVCIGFLIHALRMNYQLIQSILIAFAHDGFMIAVFALWTEPTFINKPQVQKLSLMNNQ
jgi:hypothetical protein